MFDTIDPVSDQRRAASRLLAGLRSVLAGRRSHARVVHDHDVRRWGLDGLSDHELRDIGLEGRVRVRRWSHYPHF